ncbi:family A G protein-coupled receptor-like protein [Bimuria novae-zelandiae CBS 107.79]|uniref:Family A G protein-coupled receptor-like protein n=1 Tax=Bimuria novae-zelandiae CBS 107.79 TaxID=1447943 RepID=A0A6A5ULC6_9PLEO|nr:family A G protein-coupled receptor-like protein [Bimuria novae-zelandiae CBS 107.79]
MDTAIGIDQVAARGVLSAPDSPHQITVLNRVILAVSVLSILGAGWIISSFCTFKELRTFRHQLILGLAISDFFMTVNFLSSCVANLLGDSLGKHQPFCSFNGFMTQFFVVQTDYWVLTIAICTFLVLANHKHKATWIQEHRTILWCLPWGFSILWAVLGVGLDGYSNIGAWCWFGSDKARLLINFVPRWLIIIVILGLYIRLYRIIYRAHEQFISFHDESTPHTLSGTSPETDTSFSAHRIGRPSASMHITSKDGTIEVERHGRTHVQRPNPLLKKLAKQMMYYPLAYMLIWTIPTAIRIYQSVTGVPAPFGVATVDKACIVIQGFIDALIYGVNESSKDVWRNKFRKPSPMAPAPAPVQVNIEHEIRVEREPMGRTESAGSSVHIV